MKMIYCMLNRGKCKKLMLVATGDLQLEIVTCGIVGRSARLKCLGAALESCSSQLKNGIRDGILLARLEIFGLLVQNVRRSCEIR